MNDAPPAYAVSLTIGLAFLVSLATLFRLFQKHIDGRPLLEYEPRRPVPWNFLAPLIILAPLILALSQAGEREQEPDARITAATTIDAAAVIAAGAPPSTALHATYFSTLGLELAQRLATAETLAWRLLLQSLMMAAVALAAYLLLAAMFGATAQDLGLPRDLRQLMHDIKIGATACVASMAPIYLLMYVLTALLEPESGHPLIEELVVDHSLSMMAAAAVAAVVAAPLFEETAFRLILQGWLERREMLSQPVMTTEIAPPTNEAGFHREGEAPAEPGIVYQRSARQEPRPPEVEALIAPQVTCTYAPPGWIPIIISGTLFGLAHYGHGVSPIPLILLGGVMGYMYQRTHRITPSIVCHFLFNAFTFLLLSLQFTDI